MVVSGCRDWKNAIAGRVWIDAEHGRIGFMSTQRRQARWQRSICMVRAGAPDWPATNSLQSDHRTIQLVRFVFVEIRRGAPPCGARSREATGTPAKQRSSLPLLPSPPGFEPIHLTLPYSVTRVDVPRRYAR